MKTIENGIDFEMSEITKKGDVKDLRISNLKEHIAIQDERIRVLNHEINILRELLKK